MQVYGMTKAEAGNVLSMLAVGMIVGSPLLSWVSNRVFRARKPVIVIAAAVVVGLTWLLAFHTEGIPMGVHYGICLGLGIFSSAVVVIGFTLTKESFPISMAGTAVGLVNLFPFAGGAVFQPLLGWVLEFHGRTDAGFFTLDGYRAAFLVLFASAATALAASLFLKESYAEGAS
jgi:sugar phosphate permease